MNEHIESKQVKVLHKTYTIKIYPDDIPINPREDCDNLGTIIYWSNRYNLGEINGRSGNIDAKDFVKQKTKEGAVILPVYIYDHSGITINTTGFSCQWDSGQVGWIFADKEAIRKWFEVKRITKKLRDQVSRHLVEEIGIFDKYIQGDAYGFKIKDEDEQNIDSCWGFYDKEECMKYAEANVPSEQDILNDIKEKEKQQEEALQNLVGIA
jgi:hypothetical protein